ncbi:MAG: ribonuclease H-like domain-containing protein [Eubacterium sp.]|nr:ribonuclease H-like domain-containing protein [Eubacterium sp.]
MLKFDESVNASQVPEWDRLAAVFGRENVLMFDLETTGLSPRNSFIYIIGINLWQDGSWHILQLFNDDGCSEPEMIEAFMELLEGKKALFHFNGNTFDIPFVRGRMEKIRSTAGREIPDRMSDVLSVDLLKEIRPFKYALGLPNVRQKTVEQYLGICREDKYDGGQLIDVYLSFLSSGSLRSRSLVLLHNRDDMEGMFHLAGLHALTELCAGNFTLGTLSMEQEGNALRLILPVNPEHPLPHPLVTTGGGMALTGEGDHLVLKLPVFSETMVCRITKDLTEGFFLPAADFTGVTVYCRPEQKKTDYVAADDSLLGRPEILHAYAACLIRALMNQNGKL